MSEGLWACATVGRAHGLHGEVYLDLLPRGFDYLSRGSSFVLGREGAVGLQPARVEHAGGADRRPLVRFVGVTTREQARALYGAVLFARGPELDEGEHYAVRDLLGVRVVSGGRELGQVTDVLANPVHDVLEIAPAGGGPTLLVPLVPELVEIDLNAGLIRVKEGLL